MAEHAHEVKLPTLSVVLPNYNHGEHLGRCLASILSQSVAALEVIVVDDGSTDNSVAIMEELARQHPVIRFLRNEKNSGAVFSFNRGIDAATGDYLVMVAADDELRPGYFEKALRLLAQHPGAGICAGICEFRDMTSGLTWYLGTFLGDKERFMTPDEMVTLGRQGKLVVATGAMIVKREPFLAVGKYRKELEWHCDWFAYFVVAFRHGMCFVPEVLAEFRLYPSSFSNKGMRQPERQREVLRRILELLEQPEFHDAAERFRECGALSSFGRPMFKLLIGDRRFRKYLTPTYLRAVTWWSAKYAARKMLPDRVARFCLKVAGYSKLPRAGTP
ncbi:MAG TPA: glycosyltransferase [Verrucomicrobiae bacterium]|jgi:glycosyltransferase involved in cell wall biosynthesis|nr:glycosyltransferase [Verrucomicrobiae bacterium]